VRRLAADGLVHVEAAAGETIYQVVDEKRPVLDYHRNAVIHRYVAPALVATAARAGAVDFRDLRSRTQWLSRLFKLEFMYPVDAPFDEIFEENVAFLVRVGALSREGERVGRGAEEWILAFLSEFMRAYLESYRIAVETALAALAGGRGDSVAPDRRTLVQDALERGRAAFLSGGVALREALSKATLENAVEWLVSQRFLDEREGRIHVGGGGVEALRAIADGIALHLVD
jgi:glycerol-3-phosphate O-acyltransferase